MAVRLGSNLRQYGFQLLRQFFILYNRSSAIPTDFKLQGILRGRRQVEIFEGIEQLKSSKPLLLLWTVPFLSTRGKEEEAGQLKATLTSQQKDVISAIHKADNFFECNNYQDSIAVLLPYKDGKDVEILWRLSRAQYNLAQLTTVPETEKRQLIYDAYDAILEALALDDGHWAAHKWMSVLLDARANYDGIKARISQLERVKMHMLKAAELNPKDATTLYMIGSWFVKFKFCNTKCYQIADMPWFQRKIAATIFAAPPTSSFEEAFHYFSKAEEIEPKFYSKNLLMLGKTLLKLQRVKEASSYLSQAKDFPVSSEEDELVRKEACEILKTLKVDQDSQ